MSKFFIKRGEEVRGPISLGQIKELADAGKLRETDLVGRDETGVFTAVTHYFKIEGDQGSRKGEPSGAGEAPASVDRATTAAVSVSRQAIKQASQVQSPEDTGKANLEIQVKTRRTVAPVTPPRMESAPVEPPMSGTASHRTFWVIGGIVCGAFAILMFGLILTYTGESALQTVDVNKRTEVKTSPNRPGNAVATPAPMYSFVVPEELETLPPNFKSFTLRELTQELEEQVRSRPKGEFEKTTDWIVSQENLWASTTLFNQPGNSKFIYCYDKKFYKFAYDPDSEQSSVILSNPETIEVDGDILTTWRFENFPMSEWRELNWNCEPAAAKTQAANLRVAIVFTMGLPVQRQKGSDAKRFSPLIETRNFFRSLADGRASSAVEKTVWISQLCEVVAYRNDTGEIIAKRDLRDERSIQRYFSNNKKGLFGKLAISPDSSMIASSHREGVIEIADVESGSLLRYLYGQRGDVQGVDFHPNNLWVATCSSDETAKIWDVENGEIVHELVGHMDDIDSVKFSHDGKLLATGGDEGILRVFEVSSGKLLKSMTTHRDVDFGGSGDSRMQDRFQAIQEVAFSPNDRLLATVGYSEDPVVVFDMNSGKRLGAFAADETNTNSIVFTLDGRYIITGGSDGDISVWDTLALTKGPTVEDLWGNVPADVQPDRWARDATRSTRYRLEMLRRLAGEADFDLADVAKARGLARTMEVAGEIETVRLSPDGKLVAALNKNNIYVFEFSTGEKITEHHVGNYTSGQDIQFSKDGKWLALKTTNSGTIFHLDTFLKGNGE